ncbi:hypothetical protein ABZZ79_18245 [Streptomyces sp. NPDC006458]|uniref:hypothetical protein n=1 Tax=Streptomyces sp. NPDC006458 TaxID=3154302 RepID=UPI0033BAECB3
MFFPPSSTTGYRPGTPAPPHPSPAPTPTPPPWVRPAPPRPAKKKNGCVSGCFGLLMVFALLTLIGRGCSADWDTSGGGPDSDATADTRGATACPERIAAELPDGSGAELVEAFRTGNKQITLCRTGSGSLYYYGEFSDGREKGIAMKAERTGSGYVAHNGPYRYEIHDGVVTVYQSGRQIGEEDLTEEPSPS